MAIVGFDDPANEFASEALGRSRDTAVLLSPRVRSSRARRHRRRVGLPAEPRAVAAARHAVNFACVLWSATELRETAACCVSELVTNAVLHAAWPQDSSERVVWLTLSVAGPFFLVEVADPDPRLPVVGSGADWDGFNWSATASGDQHGEHGFGLPLVIEMVRETRCEFGAVLTGAGKTVFFALPLDTWLPPSNVAARQTAEV